MRWIDRIPKWLLVAVAVYLAGAPFVPEPHLTEKWRMLLDGTLSKPVDVFDFFCTPRPWWCWLFACGVTRSAAARAKTEISPP